MPLSVVLYRCLSHVVCVCVCQMLKGLLTRKREKTPEEDADEVEVESTDDEDDTTGTPAR